MRTLPAQRGECSSGPGPRSLECSIPECRPRPSARELAVFAAAAVAFRVVLLALDAHPRFFLGDSASYLDTAFGYWIPPDRSWLYGLEINAVFRVFHRFLAVMAVQSLLSAAMCAGAAALLRWLGVRRALAWTVLVLLSLDPLLLYYDRSFLTDAPGTAAVWLGIVFAVLALLEGGAWRWLLSIGCLSLAITLRTALLPLVMLVPAFSLVFGGALAWSARARGWASLRCLVGPTCFAAAVVASLAAYAAATGLVTRSRPQLNPKSGYFLLGTVAPIVAAQDFRGLGIRDPEGLLRETHPERFTSRNEQIYLEGGLLLRIEEETGSWQRTSRIGSRVASRAIRRDPLGFGRLVLAVGEEYLSPRSYLGGSFAGGFGLDRPLPDGLVDSLRRKVRDPVDPATPARPSLVLTWLRGWSFVLPIIAWLGLLMPLAALLPARRTVACRAVMLLLAAATWAHLLSTFAFSTVFTQRYLLPLSPLLLSMAAIELERCAAWIVRRRTGAEAGATAP